MNIHSLYNVLLNIQSSFLDILDFHLDIYSNSGYSKGENSKRKFMNIFEDIHVNFSSSWDILFNLERFTKIFR